MNFCSECGKTVSARIPSGDTRSRFICDHCETVHYQNPRIVAGCLATHQGYVLLCRRAIDPRAGFWTLPAGYMENGETTEDMFFRGELADLNFSAGEESLEVRLFSEAEIPWTELAFPTVGKTLKQYFIDRQTNEFPVRIRDILYRPQQAR